MIIRRIQNLSFTLKIKIIIIFFKMIIIIRKKKVNYKMKNIYKIILKMVMIFHNNLIKIRKITIKVIKITTK